VCRFDGINCHDSTRAGNRRLTWGDSVVWSGPQWRENGLFGRCVPQSGRKLLNGHKRREGSQRLYFLETSAQITSVYPDTTSFFTLLSMRLMVDAWWSSVSAWIVLDLQLSEVVGVGGFRDMSSEFGRLGLGLGRHADHSKWKTTCLKA
jgi:hypothetical protein